MKRDFEVGQIVVVDGQQAIVITVCRISLIVRFHGDDFTRTVRKSRVQS
mgnify:CR=1 FL=1